MIAVLLLALGASDVGLDGGETSTDNDRFSAAIQTCVSRPLKDRLTCLLEAGAGGKERWRMIDAERARQRDAGSPSPEDMNRAALRQCQGLIGQGPRFGECVGAAGAAYEELYFREVASAWAAIVERSERQAQEKAERTRVRKEADAAVRADPAKMRLAVSLALCGSRDIETIALTLIKEEKVNSKIAGVVNAAKLLELQNQVAAQRKLRPRLSAMLGKSKPHRCESKDLEPLRHCVMADESKLPPECAAPADQALARLPAILLMEEEMKLRAQE